MQIIFQTDLMYSFSKRCLTGKVSTQLYYIRQRPFNLKGGDYCFFLKKNILIPNITEKNILILVEENKKLSDSEFLSYSLMLNSGKKFRALRYKKNKYSNSRVVRKKNSERNKKPKSLQVKW